MPENQESSSEENDNDLIRQVADLVYKMLLQEARTDFERRRLARQLHRYFGGQ